MHFNRESYYGHGPESPDVEAVCPNCGEAEFIAYNCTYVSDDDPPVYTHEFQCDECRTTFEAS